MAVWEEKSGLSLLDVIIISAAQHLRGGVTRDSALYFINVLHSSYSAPTQLHETRSKIRLVNKAARPHLELELTDSRFGRRFGLVALVDTLVFWSCNFSLISVFSDWDVLTIWFLALMMFSLSPWVNTPPRFLLFSAFWNIKKWSETLHDDRPTYLRGPGAGPGFILH